MMLIDRIKRGAPAWGGALLMLAAPGLASAQDRPATGPSTTQPETNKDSPQNPSFGARPVMPKSPNQVLPAVPATATDPAPPGTRSVRVDLPRTGLPAAGGATAAGRPMSNMRSVEGIVTAINKKGSDLKNETVRITVDPSQGWESYVMGPSAGPAEPPTTVASGTPPTKLDFILTGRTYTLAHARTLDGVDLVGAATEASPDDTRLRSDALGSHMRLQRTSDPETSWTNIKVGSYVLVRYRKVGDLNEAANVSLIQPPLNPEAAAAARTSTAPAPDGTVQGRVNPIGGGPVAPAPGTTSRGAPTVPETKSPTSPGSIP